MFLRRNLLPNLGRVDTLILAIHIIMGRTNAKTLDCYIELSSAEVQNIIMDRYNNSLSFGNPPKMTNRHVSIDTSSQAELMKEVFPLACCMDYRSQFAIPVKVKNTDQYSSGFKGFKMAEELSTLIRNMADPERVNISSQPSMKITNLKRRTHTVASASSVHSR